MILMRNHFNGGSVIVVEDTSNDKIKSCKENEIIRIDEILPINEAEDDELNESSYLAESDVIDKKYCNNGTTWVRTSSGRNEKVSYMILDTFSSLLSRRIEIFDVCCIRNETYIVFFQYRCDMSFGSQY